MFKKTSHDEKYLNDFAVDARWKSNVINKPHTLHHSVNGDFFFDVITFINGWKPVVSDPNPFSKFWNIITSPNSE